MLDIDQIAARYLGADYLRDSPAWDSEDSPWKPGKVRELLESNAFTPVSIARAVRRFLGAAEEPANPMPPREFIQQIIAHQD